MGYGKDGGLFLRNLDLLSHALDYIETNIREPITPADVANACACSLSAMQKLFSYALHFSISNYIAKRRHSLACRDLLMTDLSVCEIAMRYQYNSHEVFLRAFVRLRGMTPSEFRKHGGIPNLHPKISLKTEGSNMRKVDISDLYDTLKALRGTYVIYADIQGLSVLNDTYGRAAGDLALALAAGRLSDAASDGMFAFRTGGDEFVLVTALAEEAPARALLDKIAARDGEPVLYNGQSIPLSLHLGLSRLSTGILSDLADEVRKVTHPL